MEYTKELIGKTFNQLTIIELVKKPKGLNSDRRYLRCKCSCGGETVTRYSRVISGHTKSCGCIHKGPTTHGMKGTVEYSILCGMKVRCYNERDKAYKWYGAKGITICDRWLEPEKGPLNFLEDMGHRPSPKHSLDRIDGTKGYSKDNCRWATYKEQIRNRSTTIMISYRGETKPLGEWCEKLKLDYQRTFKRLKEQQLSPEEAFGFKNRKGLKAVLVIDTWNTSCVIYASVKQLRGEFPRYNKHINKGSLYKGRYKLEHLNPK